MAGPSWRSGTAAQTRAAINSYGSPIATALIGDDGSPETGPFVAQRGARTCEALCRGYFLYEFRQDRELATSISRHGVDRRISPPANPWDSQHSDRSLSVGNGAVSDAGSHHPRARDSNLATEFRLQYDGLQG